MQQAMLESLYTQHSTGVYRFALSILHSPQDAEDVTQETFLRAMNAGLFRIRPGKERAFLYKVARNLSYNLLRDRKRECPAEEPAAQDQYDVEYLQYLTCLSETERNIVTLKLLAGATHAEIAKILGITVHTAKKRYARALDKVRAAYEEGMT